MATKFTPLTKFYLSYSWTEAKKHKCNTCLGICSVFIVVVIAALCYTLVDNAAVVFFREGEQDFGQYDVLLTPQTGPFFNYSLMSNILTSNSLHYHSPRLLFNNSVNYLFSSKCYDHISSTDDVYHEDGCISTIMNATNCDEYSQNQVSSFAFWLIDFDKENNMKLGRTFDFNDKPENNEIIISDTIASDLNLAIGDTTYLLLPIDDLAVPILQNYISQLLDLNGIDVQRQNSSEFVDLLNMIQYECTNNIIPVKISSISSDKSLGGKFAETRRRWDVVMNIHDFMELFINNLPPMILNKIKEYKYKNEITQYDFTNMVYVNLGTDRVESYLSTNYQDIEKILVGFTAKMSYWLGWIEMEISMDVLNSMSKSSSTMLSLGVVLDIIIFVLILLSIILLYSLLIISVAGKTFTMGIFRMLGMTKKELIILLESQAFSYAFPAWCLGLIIAQIGSIYVLGLLGASSNIDLNKLLTPTSILIATFVGLGMSFLASILPIRACLGQTLQASLDIHHSKTNAVAFDIARTDAKFAWGTFFICDVLVTFGWVIYYFFPQSLIGGDLELFAIMLMCLMLSILVGFILFGLNLQHLLERFVLFFTLSWWERRPIPEIVLKNLIAHKIRNRKTAVMYAFSLSFIFFVTVMISTQLSVLEMSNIKNYGSKLFCWTGRASLELENTLNRIEYIEDYAWKPGPVRNYQYGHDFHVDYTKILNIGKTKHEYMYIYPTVPNFGTVVDENFIVPYPESRYDHKKTSLTSTEQLFTAYGSQRMLIGEHVSSKMHLKSVDDELLLNFYSNVEGETYVQYHRMRTQEWFTLYPFYRLIALHSDEAAAVLPITAFPRLFNTTNGLQSIEDAWYTALLIKFKPSVLNSEIDRIKSILSGYCYSIKDYRTVEKQVVEASSMLDLIFSFMTYAALALCLFSLVSSMFANIMEQSKEIGILRSMGLTKFQINKIYIYEALIIILSSSLLGFLVGYTVSFVIVQQQKLFSQYPIELVVPSSVIFAVSSGAILTSVASVYFPLTALNKKQISQNMRDISL